jgi:hypothetical protein
MKLIMFNVSNIVQHPAAVFGEHRGQYVLCATIC